MTKDVKLLTFAVGLVLVTCVAAIVQWGDNYSWELSSLSIYQIFPLLGLLAFSIMWSHYVTGTVREILDVGLASLKPYFRYTGYLVLILIVLHPGLLIFQLARDGLGLPPGSYSSYVRPGLAWVATLGTVSLLVFLAFETKRWFGKKSWWHFIPEAGDFAMIAIFYHGLRLGSQINGWYKGVWIFYGVILIAVIVRSYLVKYVLPTKKPGVNSRLF